jgi:hypothetical protein
MIQSAVHSNQKVQKKTTYFTCDTEKLVADCGRVGQDEIAVDEMMTSRKDEVLQTIVTS